MGYRLSAVLLDRRKYLESSYGHKWSSSGEIINLSTSNAQHAQVVIVRMLTSNKRINCTARSNLSNLFTCLGVNHLTLNLQKTNYNSQYFSSPTICIKRWLKYCFSPQQSQIKLHCPIKITRLAPSFRSLLASRLQQSPSQLQMGVSAKDQI